MARNFTFKEVNELSNEYKTNIKKIEKLELYPSESIQKIKNILSQFESSGFFGRMLSEALENDKVSIDVKSTELLISELFFYMQTKDLCQQAKLLKLQNITEIRTKLDNIAPATNPIKWALSFGKKKQFASEQYEELISDKDGYFYKTMLHLINQFDNIKKRIQRVLF